MQRVDRYKKRWVRTRKPTLRVVSERQMIQGETDEKNLWASSVLKVTRWDKDKLVVARGMIEQ